MHDLSSQSGGYEELCLLDDYTALYPEDRTLPQIRDSFLSCYITNISSKLWDTIVLLN
jgi:hypothetical protein